MEKNKKQMAIGSFYFNGLQQEKPGNCFPIRFFLFSG